MGEEELALSGEQVDLAQFVNDEGGIWSLRQVEKVRGWNSIEYGAGLSGKNTPATALSMNRAYIPPGGVAKAHIVGASMGEGVAQCNHSIPVDASPCEINYSADSTHDLVSSTTVV